MSLHPAFSGNVATFVATNSIYRIFSDFQSRQKYCLIKTKSTQNRSFKCLMLELLSRFELETSSLPTAMAIFFTYFPLVYVYFRFISFAFRHSLKASFPCVPRLSVAVYVVRNPCGAWSSSPEAILFQAKKVVKFESGCLKPTVNFGEVSSDELHLRLQ